MLRQLSAVYLGACVSLALGSVSFAQSDSNFTPLPPGAGYPSNGQYIQPPRTLGDRLQQFKQDVLGEPTPPQQRPTSPSRVTQRSTAPPSGGQRTGTFSGVPKVASKPATVPAAPVTAPPPPTVEEDVASEEPAELPTARRSRDESAADEFSAPAKRPSALNSLPVDAAQQKLRARSPRNSQAEGDEPTPASSPSAEPAPLRTARNEPVALPLNPAPAKTRVSEETAGPSSEKHAAGLLFTSKSASLTLETIGPRAISLGKEAEYTVKVRNVSDSLASGVVIAIQIPSHVEVLNSKPTGGAMLSPSGAEPSRILEWRINRLDAHAKESLTLKLIPRKTAPIELAMQWSTTPDTTQTTVEVQEPRLTMNLSGATEILYGQSKVYKITVTNPGNGDAENVVVTLLPVGRGSESGASRRLGVLRPGQSRSIEVELTARQSGTLTIKAEASADGGLTAEAIEQVLVRRANLKVAVRGPKAKFAGTVANYHITVANTGNAPAEAVQVTAVLPAQAKYISGAAGAKPEISQGKLAWNAGSLAAGAERTYEVVCSLAAAGENRLQVTASGADDLASSSLAVTHVEALADLKLEIRDPQGPVSLGDEALYEVIVRNRGTKSAEGIDLVVFFSEGLEAVRAHGGGHKIERGQVVFDRIPSLAAGSELVLKIHAKSESAASHIFRAEVVCQTPQIKLAAEETTLFYGDDADKAETAADASASPGLQKSSR